MIAGLEPLATKDSDDPAESADQPEEHEQNGEGSNGHDDEQRGGNPGDAQ
jgi:hypothetical protein